VGAPAAQPLDAGISDLSDLAAALPALLSGGQCQEVQADFNVTTSSEWIIASVEGEFRIRLDPAAEPAEQPVASREGMAFMEERMKLCPISKNLPESVGKTINVKTMA
jgi:hypothetical protein